MGTNMSRDTLAILTNPEVVSIDQDAKGVQARRAWQVGPHEVWTRPLADGSTAVLLINEGEDTERITVRFSDVGASGTKSVRDLWAHKELGQSKDTFAADVPKHGVVLVKLH